MGLSLTIFEIYGDFSQKLQIFPTLVNLMPQLRGFPLELGNGAWAQKAE